MRRTNLLCAAALLTGGTILSGAEGNPPPPRVVTAKARIVTEASPRRYVGAVESIRHVDLIPRVTGELWKINFREGETVREGDVLYEIEDTSYRASVDALSAQKEQLEAALRYADTEYKRSDRLLRSQAASVSSHDKAVLEIDSAKAKIREIEASLVQAKTNLSYTKITAPLTGRIGKSLQTAGNLLTPQGGKINDIEMTAPIYVRFSLSERVFRRDFGGAEGIREKAVVRLRLADGTLYGETARVTLIDNKINASTNTLTVWATFENRDGKLLPGGFVTVSVSAKTDGRGVAAVVPSALVTEEDGTCVYVLGPENTVEKRKVEAGEIAGDVQLILSGLSGTETVVSDGMNKLSPGMRVDPVPADSLK